MFWKLFFYWPGSGSAFDQCGSTSLHTYIKKNAYSNKYKNETKLFPVCDVSELYVYGSYNA